MRSCATETNLLLIAICAVFICSLTSCSKWNYQSSSKSPREWPNDPLEIPKHPQAPRRVCSLNGYEVSYFGSEFEPYFCLTKDGRRLYKQQWNKLESEPAELRLKKLGKTGELFLLVNSRGEGAGGYSKIIKCLPLPKVVLDLRNDQQSIGLSSIEDSSNTTEDVYLATNFRDLYGARSVQIETALEWNGEKFALDPDGTKRLRPTKESMNAIEEMFHPNGEQNLRPSKWEFGTWPPVEMDEIVLQLLNVGDEREAKAFLSRCWSPKIEGREKHWNILKKVVEDSKPEFL